MRAVSVVVGGGDVVVVVAVDTTVAVGSAADIVAVAPDGLQSSARHLVVVVVIVVTLVGAAVVVVAAVVWGSRKWHDGSRSSLRKVQHVLNSYRPVQQSWRIRGSKTFFCGHQPTTSHSTSLPSRRREMIRDRLLDGDCFRSCRNHRLPCCCCAFVRTTAKSPWCCLTRPVETSR